MKGYFEFQLKNVELPEATKIYTDGSFKHLIKKGTFACILTDTTTGKTIKQKGLVKTELDWINARVCEMYAIINGIELAIKNGIKSALIYTDNKECMYIAGNYNCKAREKEWFINKLTELDKKCSLTIINISREHKMIKQAHKECQNAYLLN